MEFKLTIFLIIMLLNSPLALCSRTMPPSPTPAGNLKSNSVGSPFSSSPTRGTTPPTDGDSGSSWGTTPPTDGDSDGDSGSSSSPPDWGTSPPTDGDSSSSSSPPDWGTSPPTDGDSGTSSPTPTWGSSGGSSGGSFSFPSVPTSGSGSFGFPTSGSGSGSGSFGSFGKEQIDNYHRMEAGNIEKYCESTPNPTMCKNMILPYFKAATGIGGGGNGDSQP